MEKEPQVDRSGRHATNEESLLEQALRSASDTRLLIARAGVRHQAADVFAAQFGSGQAVVMADENTLAAAGRDVCDSFRRARHPLQTTLETKRHATSRGWLPT